MLVAIFGFTHFTLAQANYTIFECAIWPVFECMQITSCA
jgi:hypothetical protein